MYTTVVADTSSVEALLLAANAALSPVGLGGWLGGPMTQQMQQRAAERFRVEGTDEGPWAPLRDATINWRESLGFPPGPINRRTGELERYITQSDSSVVPHGEGVSAIFPGSSPSGELAEKLATAQGAESPRVPARPVLGLGAPDVEFALASLTAYFNAAFVGGRS